MEDTYLPRNRCLTFRFWRELLKLRGFTSIPVLFSLDRVNARESAVESSSLIRDRNCDLDDQVRNSCRFRSV